MLSVVWLLLPDFVLLSGVFNADKLKGKNAKALGFNPWNENAMQVRSIESLCVYVWPCNLATLCLSLTQLSRCCLRLSCCRCLTMVLQRGFTPFKPLGTIERAPEGRGKGEERTVANCGIELRLSCCSHADFLLVSNPAQPESWIKTHTFSLVPAVVNSAGSGCQI